jgi:ABC-type sugar transport system permease subunit
MEASLSKDSSARQTSRFVRTLLQMKARWYCYVMIAGTFLLLLTFDYIPAFSAIYHSFTKWDGFRPPAWVGLKHYQAVFTDPVLLKGAGNALLLGSWGMLISVTVPLIAAALVFHVRSERLANFFRLLFVLPIVVPGLVGLYVWQELYNPNTGLLNEILQWLGREPLAWLNAPKTALFSIMFAGFPWVDGIGLLIYLAGFLAIPQEVLEAATVDGAGKWKRFFSVELPLVMPQVRLTALLNVIGAFQDFGWQLVVTQGGPLRATTVPAWEMYYRAMEGGRYGAASTIGMLLFIVIFALTLLNEKVFTTASYFEEVA